MTTEKTIALTRRTFVGKVIRSTYFTLNWGISLLELNKSLEIPKSLILLMQRLECNDVNDLHKVILKIADIMTWIYYVVKL